MTDGTWVLILFALGYGSVSAEFTSKARCEQAAHEILTKNTTWYSPTKRKWITSSDKHFRLSYRRNVHACVRK